MLTCQITTIPFCNSVYNIAVEKVHLIMTVQIKVIPFKVTKDSIVTMQCEGAIGIVKAYYVSDFCHHCV